MGSPELTLRAMVVAAASCRVMSSSCCCRCVGVSAGATHLVAAPFECLAQLWGLLGAGHVSDTERVPEGGKGAVRLLGSRSWVAGLKRERVQPRGATMWQGCRGVAVTHVPWSMCQE